jgi:threonine dehydratase
MPDTFTPAVTRADVDAAAARIAGHVRRTPVISVDPADFGLSGFRLVLKLEFLQHAGSFKARGAFNTLLSLPVPAAGVVAASGGNHGAAVAFAAGRLGHRARIFVPAVASPAKIAQIRAYGADLTIAGERYADALAASEACVADTGALPIHAFDMAATLAGQGTVAREFAAQAAPDTILVATGGGGLIGGMAAWCAGTPRLVSVEPETAPALHDALAAGHPVDAPAGGYAADSLAPARVGQLMYPLAAAHIGRAVLVPDAAILAAHRLLWQHLRVVVEPGGATALAALTTGAYTPAPGENVGVLLCGANCTAVSFPETV